jgi:hypothetical protein
MASVTSEIQTTWLIWETLDRTSLRRLHAEEEDSAVNACVPVCEYLDDETSNVAFALVVASATIINCAQSLMKRRDTRIKPSLLTTMIQQGIRNSDRSAACISHKGLRCRCAGAMRILLHENEKPADMSATPTCQVCIIEANVLFRLSD